MMTGNAGTIKSKLSLLYLNQNFPRCALSGSRDAVVGIVSSCSLDSLEIVVRFPDGTANSSLLQSVQIGSHNLLFTGH
jgi:hypothetical protein